MDKGGRKKILTRADSLSYMSKGGGIESIIGDRKIPTRGPWKRGLPSFPLDDGPEAAFLDLHLSISKGIVSIKIYDKRDDFDLKLSISHF